MALGDVVGWGGGTPVGVTREGRGRGARGEQGAVAQASGRWAGGTEASGDPGCWSRPRRAEGQSGRLPAAPSQPLGRVQGSAAQNVRVSGRRQSPRFILQTQTDYALKTRGVQKPQRETHDQTHRQPGPALDDRLQIDLAMERDTDTSDTSQLNQASPAKRTPFQTRKSISTMHVNPIN